jgi:hypothetical protein
MFALHDFLLPKKRASTRKNTTKIDKSALPHRYSSREQALVLGFFQCLRSSYDGRFGWAARFFFLTNHEPAAY